MHNAQTAPLPELIEGRHKDARDSFHPPTGQPGPAEPLSKRITKPGQIIEKTDRAGTRNGALSYQERSRTLKS